MKREEAEAIYDLGKEAVVEILLKIDLLRYRTLFAKS
jgi:hypothetical protein